MWQLNLGEEVEDLKATFQKLDKDGDSRLSWWELYDAYVDTYGDMTLTEVDKIM